MKLYSTLASWWPLVSCVADYAEEAEQSWRIMSEHATRPIETMLELGCGGGNNAFHLKARCRMTLTDLSPDMLAVSRQLNPECQHIEGDMRSLRLGREFDAVFTQDAIMHMRTEGDLREAMATAYAHCALGGVAMFVTDATRETFAPTTAHGGHDGQNDDTRSLRYLEWTCDPDPSDTEYVMDMVLILREGDGPPRIEHVRLTLGLFSEATWLRLLAEVGFVSATVEPCRFSGGEQVSCFVGVRVA